MSGWWRRNRLWLAALPFALAALLASASYNAKNYWWGTAPHHQVASAASGDYVEVTQDYDDFYGATSRTFSVRFDATDTEATYPFESGDVDPPAGTEALVVHLDWKAAPDQVIDFCTVAVEDDQGRRYGLPQDSASDSCVPSGQEGPHDPQLEGERRGEVTDGAARPATWSTAPVFLVPQGLKVARVLVWWRLPDYVALSAS